MIFIRTENPADAAAVWEVNVEAFGREEEAKLVDALRRRTDFVRELSLVATTGENEIVGACLFSPIWIVREERESVPSLALAPVAVRTSWQRRGVGGQLIREGLQRAKLLGFGSVIVLGHAEYYSRFGFVPADRWHIAPPFDVPREAWMALELVEDCVRDARGIVEYPPEFGGV
ncbi:MAG: GNAT family N-acetyltransferase [Thermoguttaceae bacterium]